LNVTAVEPEAVTAFEKPPTAFEKPPTAFEKPPTASPKENIITNYRDDVPVLGRVGKQKRKKGTKKENNKKSKKIRRKSYKNKK
jgi:hypothetical protein